MKITITGDGPSKKNNKVKVYSRGQEFWVPNAIHESWHRQAIKQLTGIKTQTAFKQIDLTFYPQTKRKSDLTNRAESIMDLLVDGGVLEDDNWFICPEIRLHFGGVEPKNPRVEIEIK